MARRGSAIVSVALAALAGCGDDPAPADGSVVVGLFLFGDGDLRITGVDPAAGRALPPPSGGAWLRYAFEGDDGQVIEGKIDDFRISHSERLVDGARNRIEISRPFGAGSVRVPDRAGTLILSEPRSAGGAELGRVRHVPGGPDGELASARAAVYGDGDLLDATRVGLAGGGGGAGGHAAVDILFLAEGYSTDEELAEFVEQAQRIFDGLLQYPDYAPYAARFNGWYQRVRSRESGLDDPNAGTLVDTAFDVTYGVGDNRRAIAISGDSPSGAYKARQLGMAAEADIVLLLANTEEWAGTGDTPNPNRIKGFITMSQHPDAAFIIAHELGHSLVGLADEYPYGGCGGFVPHVNISDDPDATPWSHLVGPKHPGLGAFEGAYYCPTGVWRPEEHCMMNDSNAMCTVCRNALAAFFGAYADVGYGTAAEPSDVVIVECPDAWWGDGLCDPCLGGDPDCPENAACTVNQDCDEVFESCSTCPQDCGECSDFACGDGECSWDETVENCAQDCGCGATNGNWCGWMSPWGCWCDADCHSRDDCCSDAGPACGV